METRAVVFGRHAFGAVSPSAMERQVNHLFQPRSYLSNKHSEAKLETHDAELQMPGSGSENNATVRLLFLSSDDIGRSETLRRLEQLYDMNRGSSVAIVFLVDEDGPSGATQSFMKLQTELGDPYLLRVPPYPRLGATVQDYLN